MSILIVARAVLVRLLFAFHGIMAIWRLYMVTHEVWSWYLSGALLGLFLETLFTIAKKKGHEWKWFCPSVFFYLLSVVPAIWFLELHEIEKRIEEKVHEQIQRNVTNQTLAIQELEAFNDTKETLSLNVEEFGLNISIPIAFPADLWLRVLEQFLLLMLIIGRWILPKGAISHDQLSQLLLVYVGTAADIVEFYEAFSEEEVKYNRLLCFIILGIWTLSLLQFTLVLTATKARRDQVGLPMQISDNDEDDGACCNPELYGILTSIVLQDLPFLVVRLLLIFKYRVVSYTNMFFTSKNTLVITLLIYRLIVVQTEAAKKRRKKRESSLSNLQMHNINDINANGKKDSAKTLPNRGLSKSAPNVCQLETGRRGKRRDASPIATINVPHNYSDTNIRMENGNSTVPRKTHHKKRKS